MPSGKPLLVVLGATGNQGGSVLSYYLSQSSSPYTLRGVTRDPSSSKSTALTSRGVEVVAGDFDDPASLDAAFYGASVIFSVTDFWVGLKNPAVQKKAAASGKALPVVAMEHEALQARNIIDAAAKVDTLKRFVPSTMPNTNRLSGGKYNVYHFDGKAHGEEYGRATYPQLWEKTSVIYAGYYLENYFAYPGNMYLPTINKAKDTLTLALPKEFASIVYPMFSVAGDTGPLVDALLRAAPGKRLIGTNAWLDGAGFAKVLGQVLKKDVKFAEKEIKLDMGDPVLQKEYEDMLGFIVEFGYDGAKVDKSIVQPGHLGVEVKLDSVEEWCEKQDWEKLLTVE